MSREASARPGLLRRCVGHCRRVAVTLIAGLIIVTAIIVGIGRLLIPHADHARPWLERYLTASIGQPVTIGAIEASWPRLTPSVSLADIRVGPTDTRLATVSRARVELHLPHLFRLDRNPFRLVVLGLDLALAQGDDGRWGMRLEQGAEMGDDWAERSLAGDLTIRDATVRIAPRGLDPIALRLDEGLIRRRGSQTDLAAQLSMPGADSARVDLRLRADRGPDKAVSLRAWADGRGLPLERLSGLTGVGINAPGETLELEAWFEWSRQQGLMLDLDFAVDTLGGRRADGRLMAARQGARTDLELVALQVDGETILHGVAAARQDDQWAVAADWLSLAGVHGLLDPYLGAMFEHWPQSLAGSVEDLRAHGDDSASLHRLSGRIGALSVEPGGAGPAVAGIDLELGLSGDRAAIDLSGAPQGDWPRMIRSPVSLQSIRGRVTVSPQAIEMNNLRIGHEYADGRAHGWVWLGGERAFLDFHVVADRIEEVDPRPFLPHGRIPPRTMDWLDQALVYVGSASGGLNYHVRLGRKFRRWHAGDFQAWVEFADADLDYWPQWPAGRELDGRVEFIGRRMVGRVDRGHFGELELAANPLVIPDMSAPELSFLVLADSVEASAVHRLVASFPLPAWSGVLAPMQWQGPVSISAEVNLPLRRIADWSLDGEVSLEGVDFRLPQAGIGLSSIHGTSFFDRLGISPCVLYLGAGESRATLELVTDFRPPARMRLAGQLHPADMLLPGSGLVELSNALTGSAYWEVDLRSQEADGVLVEVDSDLNGLAITLPPPLEKKADRSRPLSLRLQLGDRALDVVGQLGEVIGVRARRQAQQWAIAAGINQAPPAVPEGPGLSVGGRVDSLDLGRWSAALRHFDGNDWSTGGEIAGRVDLSVDRLLFGEVALDGIDVSLERQPQDWVMELDGRSIAGQVRLPHPIDSGRVVVADFERLHLHEIIGETAPASLDEQPVPSQTSIMRPGGIPPLHLLIEDLSYRDLPLGRTRVETHPREDGMEIEHIKVEGEVITLDGSGHWVESEEGVTTRFQGRLMTADLSMLLRAFEFDSGVSATQTQVDIDGQWPGAPGDFSLARTTGQLQVSMRDGLIPEARPGAGRLLGLVSLSTIPRRLLLDFRDVFAQGLKYDRIEGRFDLVGGLAQTDDLVIESPAARISVSGQTDMAARTYNQQLVVEPGVGGVLPIIGGLAGGPAGAAAGLVLRTLFDRPLRGISQARYTVTGPWENPTVALVEARVEDEAGQSEVVVPGDNPD